jgi:3D (Asp-Asp-Asp) domain-containing protein
MRFLLTPIVAIAISAGSGSIESAMRLTEAERIVLPVPVAGAPSWDRIDDYLGLNRELSFPVHVTGYSSTRDQCDDDPFVTAANTRVRHGIVALSRDMLKAYTPDAPLDWGDRIHLDGIGDFVVEDSMNSRFSRRVDIWFPDRRSAKRWGVQKSQLVVLPSGAFFFNVPSEPPTI